MATILIVEDDPINFRVFAKILTKRGGFEVQGTEDVEEVLRMAQAREVDIILMDVSLSHNVYQGRAVDGLAMTKMLKDNPKTASMPVILVTDHAIEGGRKNFLEASSADSYISKPVVEHELFVHQIREMLPK
ncbi:MAG: response regulator [Prochloron sp. SP5CPC1]|nr:response regulator [Candidatus Paraprochloron terpiosi SP5CPC1]